LNQPACPDSVPSPGVSAVCRSLVWEITQRKTLMDERRLHLASVRRAPSPSPRTAVRDFALAIGASGRVAAKFARDPEMVLIHEDEPEAVRRLYDVDPEAVLEAVSSYAARIYPGAWKPRWMLAPEPASALRMAGGIDLRPGHFGRAARFVPYAGGAIVELRVRPSPHDVFHDTRLLVVEERGTVERLRAAWSEAVGSDGVERFIDAVVSAHPWPRQRDIRPRLVRAAA
jgi:hypothetical protein